MSRFQAEDESAAAKLCRCITEAFMTNEVDRDRLMSSLIAGATRLLTRVGTLPSKDRRAVTVVFLRQIRVAIYNLSIAVEDHIGRAQFVLCNEAENRERIRGEVNAQLDRISELFLGEIVR